MNEPVRSYVLIHAVASRLHNIAESLDYLNQEHRFAKDVAQTLIRIANQIHFEANNLHKEGNPDERP